MACSGSDTHSEIVAAPRVITDLLCQALSPRPARLLRGLAVGLSRRSWAVIAWWISVQPRLGGRIQNAGFCTKSFHPLGSRMLGESHVDPVWNGGVQVDFCILFLLWLFFIHFVLKDSLPIRAEAFFFFFALNQPRERLAATGSRALTMQWSKTQQQRKTKKWPYTL